jgi:hypothetical protein
VAYQPNKNTRGLGSVWSQHKLFYEEHGDFISDPIKKFDEDLCTTLSTWVDAGDQVVLLMDANSNVTNCTISDKLSSIGLHEAITW